MNKQKLQEQIDTMREELAKMETELAEFDKVELKDDCDYHISGNGSVQYYAHSMTNNGHMRETQELAEIASKNMVTRNKLEAYAHQIDPNWRESDHDTVYSICRRLADGLYIPDTYRFTRTLGAVYMSKSTAEQICEWLNDGRIEL